MSEQAMRGALQTRLLTLGWSATQTSFEGKTFTPVSATPYQEVTTEFQSPFGRTHAGSSWSQGIFQVRVMWPLADVAANGIGAPSTRAEVIKAGFPMNLRLAAAGGFLVKVSHSPVITRGPPQGDRDVTIVRIRFKDR